MILEFIRKMFWFIPTKNEQIKYREDLKKEWMKELPDIISKVSSEQKIYDDLIKQLELSFSQPQMKIYLDCKSSAQKLIFQNTRLNHHKEEIFKPIDLL